MGLFWLAAAASVGLSQICQDRFEGGKIAAGEEVSSGLPLGSAMQFVEITWPDRPGKEKACGMLACLVRFRQCEATMS